MKKAIIILVGTGTLVLTAFSNCTGGFQADYSSTGSSNSGLKAIGDVSLLRESDAQVYIPPNLRGDLADYLSSLERVRALKPARLLPGHGPIIDDPETLLRGYLEHRREREEEIVNALRSGDSTPDALVPLIYRGLKENLFQVARETVLAHLLKLEREGRAGRRDHSWHIIEP